MSSVSTPTTLWSATKAITVTGHTRHRHKPSPVAPQFEAPTIGSTLTFGPIALAAAIARTATLQGAPPEMAVRWRHNALSDVEFLIADGLTFSLSPNLTFLADVERTVFAARVGAGITDLLMNALGYIWRDNAARLSSSLDPHADFIYAGGNASGCGVVLAEAHGSFAANVRQSMIGGRAKRKYLRQVRPHVAKVSAHGTVIHGYSIAFGSRPGSAGAFLHIAETRIRKPRGKKQAPPSSERTSAVQAIGTSLALATHRSNFTLMDAPHVVAWIDRIRATAEYPDDNTPVEFFRIPYAGRSFLGCVNSLWPLSNYPLWIEDLWDHPAWWIRFARRQFPLRRDRNQFAGLFVMEEQACERFLESLSSMIRGVRERIPELLELPSFDPVDFTKFCPIRQQLMSNCLCAVRFRPYSGHRSNMNDDSPAANALGAVLTTDGLPGRLEQTVLPGALAA